MVFGFQTHADGMLLSIRMTNSLGSPSAMNLKLRVLNSDQESLYIYLKFLIFPFMTTLNTKLIL